jgi:hypothetical protein
MSIFTDQGQTAWEIYWKHIENMLGGDQNYMVVQPLAIASRIEFDSAYPLYNRYLIPNLGIVFLLGDRYTARRQVSMLVTNILHLWTG